MDDLTGKLPLLEDIREVPLAMRRVLRNAAWVTTGLSILGLFGAIGGEAWTVSVSAVIVVAAACWLDAARRLAYCRQWWAKGKQYSEWSF